MSSATRLMFALLPLGLTLAGCGGGSTSAPPDSSGSGAPTTGSPPSGSPSPAPEGEGGDGDTDKQPPGIVKATPADRSEDAATTERIFIVFDEAIDPATVSSTSITITGPSGVVAYDFNLQDTELSLTPKVDLVSGASYTVTISSSVRDLAGNPLADDYVWQFVTASGLCSDFYHADFALVEGKDTTSMSSSLRKPGKGETYKDPAYKTCIVRVADHEEEGMATQSRNLYSRIQPFNANDSLLLVNSMDAFHLYDTKTAEYVRRLSLGGGSVEPQWHPTDPDLLYVFPNHGGMTISTVNVMTDARTVVADFRKVRSIKGYSGATSIQQVWPNAARLWTHWEGSPSKDARYWALLVETGDGSPLGMISYDLNENAITGVFDYARDGGGGGAPDHISMSPSGNYVVPSWGDDVCSSRSALGTRNRPCGLMSYSRDFSSAVGLAMRSPHSDIGIDTNGRDVIVASDYDSGWVEMWDLGTGEATRLFEIYENGNSTAMHISAKNYNKPGWVLISTYMEKTSGGWYADKLFAVEMKASPRILNIAHSYNIVETYFSETHAAVNRDFTKISFNSNWNTANKNNVDAYMVVLPKHAVPYK